MHAHDRDKNNNNHKKKEKTNEKNIRYFFNGRNGGHSSKR